MARKRNRKGNALAVAAPSRDIVKLAQEGKLTEGDLAVLSEVAANRKAILRIGALVLDHERRIGALEEAVGELAGEEEPIDIEAEKEDEDEDED